MNWVLSIACLTVCLAVVSSKLCSTEDDCREGECCVAWSSSELVRKGICMKLSRRGDYCNKAEAKIDYYGGKYVHDCPCREGLACEARGYKLKASSFLDKDRLRCRRIPTTVNPDATTVNEATETEVVVEEHTEEIAEGPGGEKPRDDDCENWEYPC